MKSSQQRGLSLIEILLSLVVIAVFLMMIVNYFYNQNEQALLVTQANGQIQQLSNASYEWQAAQSQDDFTGISLKGLQMAGLLPEDKYNQVGPWGGAITLWADSKDARYVLITIPKIPESACLNLRDRMMTLAHSQSSAAECKTGSYHISM